MNLTSRNVQGKIYKCWGREKLILNKHDLSLDIVQKKLQGK